MQIILKDVILFGYHGVHPLEKKVGTPFCINICIDLKTEQKIVSIADTLDYASVYNTVKSEFKQVEDLLEILLERIAHSISALSKNINKIDISIEKLNAPISGFNGKVGVRIIKCYS